MRTDPSKGDSWYDFYEDWELIEASIAQQYGIRIRSVYHSISWSEVQTLIAGLLPNTPLGKIIAIRAETDEDVLKSFTPEMRKIRSDWRNKQASEKLKNEEALKRSFESMELLMEAMFKQ